MRRGTESTKAGPDAPAEHMAAGPAGRRTLSRGLGRLLQHGEALVASGGLVSAAILLAVMGAMAWWTVSMQSRAAAEARANHIRSVAALMGRGIEALLAADNIDGARRLLQTTAKTEGFAAARLTLEGVERTTPDGRQTVGRVVLADASGTAPDDITLPRTWGATVDPAQSGVVEVESPVDGLGPRRVTAHLWAPTRGPALLEIEDESAAAAAAVSRWRVQAGLGAIGAAGLLGTLLAYRRMRARLRAVGAIRDALRAAGHGAASVGELAVSGALGPEAEAWNRLLAERETLWQQALADRAAEGLGTKRGRDGELQSICDAMWQGLLLVDDLSKVKYGNGAAAVFLGTKRDALAGSTLGSLITDPKVLAAVEGVASGAVKTRTTVEVDRTQERPQTRNGPGKPDAGPDGAPERGAGAGGVLRYTVRPVRKEDTARALVVIEDVTQQRVADNARNTFVAQVTHELRTPLTNIRLYVDSLIEDGADDPVKRTSAINVISQEARRLERIVGDMLSVAEIEAGQMKIVSGDVRVETLFDELKADFSAQAESKEMKLAFDLPPKLPVLQGDRDKITLALHNLVGNALKYTPAGGQVTVRVLEENGSLRVDVTDNGIGIKPEEHELIFDKFYRAKDRRISGITGSGLGLALAREVARLHGGDITVRSQVDKGSTFTLTLPAARAA